MRAEAKVLAVAPSWIEAHCVVPDGVRRGEPFRLYDYQLLYLSSFYLVRPDARAEQMAPAFVYRRGLLIGPQKVGKNPAIAGQCLLEFIGPALFAGFAGKDDGYACADHGCPCGWQYAYDVGEPMARHWPTPLVQITAFSEESTENTYDALRPMVDLGPLSDVLRKVGEDFIRHPNGHPQSRIDTVTSSDQSRLGQRATFVPQDEVGLWTRENKMSKLADTQWRNLSGMGGRASLTSNAWDPAMRSVAQQEYESAATDVYRQFMRPPKNLSFANKRERHKILQIVYPSDTRVENGGHVDLDSIEAEAADIAARDLAQASRFYGNGLETGFGRAFDIEQWKKLVMPDYQVTAQSDIVVGFDGSLFEDSTAVVACEVATGYAWLAGLWERTDYGKPFAVPQDEVDACIAALFDEYGVWRMYGDPAKWETWMATWAARYGADRVINWWMYRRLPTARAVRGFASAIASGELHHSGDERLERHIGNSFRIDIGLKDEDDTPLFRIGKESKDSRNKMDAASAAVLAWEARTHALAEGIGTVVWSAA